MGSDGSFACHAQVLFNIQVELILFQQAAFTICATVALLVPAAMADTALQQTGPHLLLGNLPQFFRAAEKLDYHYPSKFFF